VADITQCALVDSLVLRPARDLSDSEWRKLSQHLRGCRSCRERYGALSLAVMIEPEDAPTLLERADALLAAGKPREAEAEYRKFVELCGTRRGKELARVFYKLGSIREQLGGRHAAVECYDEAYRIDPTHAPTLASLGRIAIIAEEWEKARRIYRAMLLGNLEEAAGLTKAEVYFQLGVVHAKLGETAKALNMFERGLELDPQSGRLRKAIAGLRHG